MVGWRALCPESGWFMRQPSRRASGLAILGLLGFALFNYPLLGIVDGGTGLLGVPALFTHLFAVWAALIIVTFILRR